LKQQSEGAHSETADGIAVVEQRQPLGVMLHCQ
jgi:hypothetical protein